MTDKLTIQDCRDAGFCLKDGIKPACERFGFDFKTLVREGIPLDDLDGLNDINVKRACDNARERIANGR